MKMEKKIFKIGLWFLIFGILFFIVLNYKVVITALTSFFLYLWLKLVLKVQQCSSLQIQLDLWRCVVSGSEWKHEIHIRDNFTCQMCDRKEDPNHKTFQIHHIVFKCKGGSNHPSNLMLVCPECHALIHKCQPPIKRKHSKRRKSQKKRRHQQVKRGGIAIYLH